MEKKHSISEVKEKINSQKLRGGYYTPAEITQFIAEWAITNVNDKVLEPSCGDGNFIEAAIVRFKELGASKTELKKNIKGIELITEEYDKAKQRTLNLGVNSNSIVNADFFEYINSNSAVKYDAIIGNPPFIRYQNFPEKHRVLAFEMMHKIGLRPNKLTNIWVPFLVVSSSLLSSNGRLAMVIPAELFQVKYAAETRVFLAKYFERITIITFDKLVFSGIQQEVVLLLAEKKVSSHKGIRVMECGSINELKNINFKKINGSNVKPIDHSSEKWTKYFLTDDEIYLMQRIKHDKRIIQCKDILETDVGLVTGCNDFFMLTTEQVKKWKLQKYTIPVASKSNQLKGLIFDNKDFSENSQMQHAVHLFMPPNVDFQSLPRVCQEYIKYGEKMGYHSGYKCQIRKRWYITPSLWVPDGFALRQVGDYPKIVVNNSSATSTDTIHRIRFKEGINKQTAVISFLNSLTFAFSEITGRSYGGGVLTFEPTEIEEIRIPVAVKAKIDFDKVENLIRARKIENILDIVDNAILIEKLGFSKIEVDMFRNIWRKLSQRRLTRNRPKK